MGKRGFTLIEVLMAGMILIIGICIILATYANDLALNSFARNLTIAVDSAQQRIDALRNGPFGNIILANNSTFAVAGIPAGAIGVVQVTPVGNLMQITVAVCWRQPTGRVIGEDKNLNGVLDAGEDINGNGIIDSPAMITTLVASP